MIMLTTKLASFGVHAEIIVERIEHRYGSRIIDSPIGTETGQDFVFHFFADKTFIRSFFHLDDLAVIVGAIQASPIYARINFFSDIFGAGTSPLPGKCLS